MPQKAPSVYECLMPLLTQYFGLFDVADIKKTFDASCTVLHAQAAELDGRIDELFDVLLEGCEHAKLDIYEFEKAAHLFAEEMRLLRQQALHSSIPWTIPPPSFLH